MNPQPDRDLERRLQQLEDEVNTPELPPPVVPQPQQPLQTYRDNSSQPMQSQSQIKGFVNWFSGLSKVAKLVVIGGGTIVGFAILRAVISLVASLISLALLGVLLYFGYKFFLASSQKPKN